MGASATEEKIIQVICDHYLSGLDERLTIAIVAERAGISRQAFHKSYLHLKPFIIGKRPVDELLIREGADVNKAVLKNQDLVRGLKAEIAEMKSSRQSYCKSFETNLITSLMNGDVLIHRSRDLTEELKKKALHNEILKRQLDEKATAEILAQERGSIVKPPAPRNKDVQLIRLEPDMPPVLAAYADSKDKQVFIDQKLKAIARVKQKLERFLRQGNLRVVIFQQRYVNSFEKYVEAHFSKQLESMVVVNLPLASRLEVRDFIKGLSGAKPLEIHVPHCESEATIRAQRKFLFGQVPEFELSNVDKQPLPTIFDGFDRVVVFRVSQGD